MEEVTAHLDGRLAVFWSSPRVLTCGMTRLLVRELLTGHAVSLCLLERNVPLGPSPSGTVERLTIGHQRRERPLLEEVQKDLVTDFAR